jgi:hypothetical protein
MSCSPVPRFSQERLSPILEDEFTTSDALLETLFTDVKMKGKSDTLTYYTATTTPEYSTLFNGSSAIKTKKVLLRFLSKDKWKPCGDDIEGDHTLLGNKEVGMIAAAAFEPETETFSLKFKRSDLYASDHVYMCVVDIQRLLA